MVRDFGKAQRSLSKAIEIEPENSTYYLWLGRIMGKRAATSSLITAISHAKKARRSFERAVELNRKNLEALGDLFEYYLDAPGFLGGGLEKASVLSEQIAVLYPAEGAYIRFRLAEAQNNYFRAENELRLASELAPGQVGRKIDLAKYIATFGRLQESDRIFQSAAETTPGDPRLLIEQARIYIETHRNLTVARQMLSEYIASPLTPDDPPRSEAHELQKNISNRYRRVQHDPHFQDYILFHEYFHAESGQGLGAAHQTGWSALVAKLLQPRLMAEPHTHE